MRHQEARKRILERVIQAEDPDIAEVMTGIEWLCDPYGGSCAPCSNRKNKIFSAGAIREILSDERFCVSKRSCGCGVRLVSKYELQRTGNVVHNASPQLVVTDEECKKMRQSEQKSRPRLPQRRVYAIKSSNGPWIFLSIVTVTIALFGAAALIVRERKPPQQVIPGAAQDTSTHERRVVVVPPAQNPQPATSAPVGNARRIAAQRQAKKETPPQQSEPSPEPKPEVKAIPEPKPPAMTPCADCSATGILEGDVAVKVAAYMRAEADARKIASGHRAAGGNPSEEAMQKYIDDGMKVYEAEFSIQAKMMSFNGEKFRITCPFCRGSKWRSSAEAK